MYRLHDLVLDTYYTLPASVMEFALKLDGKTDPFSIDESMTGNEVVDILSILIEHDTVRNKGFRISGGYLRTLLKTGNDRKTMTYAEVLNTLLILLFLPVFFSGCYVAKDVFEFHLYYRFLNAFGRFVYDHDAVLRWIALFMGLFLGMIMHEFAHASACRAYRGKVLEYGIRISVLPGFYTLMNHDNTRKLSHRIQIYAAGIEANILLAGCFLLMSGLFPVLRSFFSTAANVNVLIFLVNSFIVNGTDGMKIAMLIIGIDDLDPGGIKAYLKGWNCIRKNTDVRRVDLIRFMAALLIMGLCWVWPLMIILDLIVIIGAVI